MYKRQIRYFIPDLLLAASWGGSMPDPPILVNKPDPVYELVDYTAK